MKAMLIREHGGPEVMHLEDVPTPTPGPGEAVIQVRAVSVNRTLDIAVRAGTYARKVALPHVVGTDPCGVVGAVGPDVGQVKVGDRVTCGAWGQSAAASRGLQMPGIHAWGGYAEYVKIPVEGLKPIPDGIDFYTACVVARHAPTAYFQLLTQGEVKAGDWVLVMGASGGLGSMAVQVAKSLGCKVIAAAGGDERVQQAVALGADAGINYRTQDLTAEARRISESGINLVLDNIGDPDTFPKAFKALARGGRLVTAGGHGGGNVMLDVNFLYLNQNRIIGGTGGRPGAYEAAMEAAAAGKLKAHIEKVMPLSQAAEAHRLVAARAVTGKVILDPTLS